MTPTRQSLKDRSVGASEGAAGRSREPAGHELRLEDTREPGTSGLSCADLTVSGKPCHQGVTWGLCRTHRERHDRRLERLAALEDQPGTCRGQTKTGNSCSNEVVQWGLCQVHKEHLEKEAIKTLMQEATRAKEPEKHSPRVQLPPLAPEEARARIQAFLDRRTHVPAADEVYTIPFEQLKITGRRALGPSLIQDDEPVSFPFFERSPKGENVLCYGVKGSMAGRDMPIASRSVFAAITHCLKYLPGYRNTCEYTGQELKVSLGAIAYKLLRGAITIDQIRFPRFSPEGKRLLQAREADEQLKIGRKLLRLSAVEMARDLMDDGFETPEVVRILRALWADDVTDEEMAEVIRVAEEETGRV